MIEPAEGMVLRPNSHQDGTRHGWILDHQRPDGAGECAAAFAVCGGSCGTKNAHHTVEQEEPLTLSPSLGCPLCGLHGWIREGMWVAA